MTPSEDPITEPMPLFQKFCRFFIVEQKRLAIGREPAIEYSGARPWKPEEVKALPAI